MNSILLPLSHTIAFRGIFVFAILIQGIAILDPANADETKEQPNILWIVSEDNGISWVGCYGGTNAKTPAIDQLAKEGFRYLNCLTTLRYVRQPDPAGSLVCTE